MGTLQGFDHVAFAVPHLVEQVQRFVDMGLTVQRQTDTYAMVADPVSGFKIELNQEAAAARFRHLGFVTDDVDGAHAELVEGGMITVEGPHRRDFARMRTAFLKEASGLEVQLVKYD